MKLKDCFFLFLYKKHPFLLFMPDRWHCCSVFNLLWLELVSVLLFLGRGLEAGAASACRIRLCMTHMWAAWCFTPLSHCSHCWDASRWGHVLGEFLHFRQWAGWHWATEGGSRIRRRGIWAESELSGSRVFHWQENLWEKRVNEKKYVLIIQALVWREDDAVWDYI